MTALRKSLVGAAIGAGMLAISGASASAAIVCAGHTCWHTTTAYEYPRHAGVVVHEDNWRWRAHERYRFREHEGRGYWRGDRWVGW